MTTNNDYAVGNVRVKLQDFDRLQKLVESGVNTLPLLNAWIVIIRTFEKRHFLKQSNGGGMWPPLKHMRERNHEKAKQDAQKIIGSGKRYNASEAETEQAMRVNRAMQVKYKPFLQRGK